MYDVGKDLKPLRKQNLVMVILYERSKLIDTFIIETGWSTGF